MVHFVFRHRLVHNKEIQLVRCCFAIRYNLCLIPWILFWPLVFWTISHLEASLKWWPGMFLRSWRLVTVNVSKCEFVSHDGFTVTDSLLQSFPRHVLAMSHFLVLHFSLARRLIEPGQTDVLSFLGRLADWARLELRRPWSFSGVLSALRRCSICYAAHHRSSI